MNARARRLDPGSLSVRMQVLEPVAAQDGLGGGARTFVLRRSVWAAFIEDGPALQTTEPLTDALATGTVRTAIAMAPPPGWRLGFEALGGARQMEVLAVQRGTMADPFDLCQVREVAP